MSYQSKRLGFSTRHMPLRSISCLRSPGLQAVCKRSLGRYWGRQSWVYHVLIRDCLLQEAALELYTQFNCCVVFLGAELKEKYYKGQPQHIHHLNCRIFTQRFLLLQLTVPCYAQLFLPRHLSCGPTALPQDFTFDRHACSLLLLCWNKAAESAVFAKHFGSHSTAGAEPVCMLCCRLLQAATLAALSLPAPSLSQ